MTTSGVTSYSMTARKIIDEALEELRVKPAGQSVSSEDAASALVMLNRMLKSWQNTGPNLWLQAEASVSLVASTATYTLTPRALDVDIVRHRVNNYDTPLLRVSRAEYLELPAKAQTGTPTLFYFFRGRDSSTITLWPVPSVSTNTLEYSYERQYEAVTSLDETLDISEEHQDTVVMSLAERLAGKFGADDQLARVAAQAAALRSDVMAADRTDSVFFWPDNQQ